MANVKIFVDFWNFQLAWNAHVKPDEGSDKSYVRIEWKDLPSVLLAELPSVLGPSTPTLNFKGATVYASVHPGPSDKDKGLKNFLHNVLGQITGFKVHVVERKPRPEKDQSEKTVEKGVDTQIVTDLFAGAINNSYDIALLISNDADFVPAVGVIQDQLNKQIVHVGFRAGGNNIRTASWSHIILDGEVAGKIRQ